MNVSCHSDHPWYSPKVPRCAIFLDGVDISAQCYAASEEEGLAYCFALDLFGDKFLDANSDEPATETFRGSIKIIPLQNGISQ